MMNSQKPHPDVDKGWAWVVLGATILGQVICCTGVATVGLFQAEFVSHFPGSNAYISLVSSVFICLTLTLGPVGSVLCNTFGIRIAMMIGAVLGSLGFVLTMFATDVTHLLATYSLMAGSGLGIMYTPLNVVLGHYFQKKRVLANGLASSSCGLGFGLGSSLTVWLIDIQGWRFALSVLGAVVLQVVVIASTYFPLSQRHTQGVSCRRPSEDSDRKWTNRRDSWLWFLRHPYWWIICTNYGLQMIGFSIHIVYFPSYALSCGISHLNLQALLTVFGIVMSLARLLGGLFCNDTSVDLLVILFGTQIIYGLSILVLPLYAKTYTTLMVYQVIMSLFNGASFVPLTPLAAQMFGVGRLATVFGGITLFGGFGYLTGPIIAGICYDESASYDLGFYTGGMSVVVSAFLLLLIPLIKVKVTVPKREELLNGDQTINEEDLGVDAEMPALEL